MENKTIVLENGFEIDIPKRLIQYLERNNIEWTWYDTRFSFYEKNKEATIKFFSELPVGQNLICSTVFTDFVQLELFIQLFYVLREKKFNFKIMLYDLPDEFYKYFNEQESSITPDELELELKNCNSDEEVIATYKKIYAFKSKMNQIFLEVLKSHDIVWLKGIHFETTLKSYEDIENNLTEKLLSDGVKTK